jgi:acetyl esterase/lipase
VSVPLAASVRDARNNALGNREVVWTTSNAAVATVAAGVVTGVGAGGPVTITATSEGVRGTSQVAVEARLGSSTTNVTYCSPGGVPQRLDVYYPGSSSSQTGPVIVYIHGGQLIAGDKAAPAGSPAGEWRPVATGGGYVFVSINYRLGPTYRYPAMIEDAKCAIRFLRANAATYRIDPNRIGVTGTSSGGYLAALIGVTDGSAGLEGTGGFAGVSSRVQAVVNEYGANMNLTVPAYSPAELECRLEAYPQPPPPAVIFSGTVINHVTRDDPPFFTIHGERDPAANPQASAELHARLTAAGVSSTLQWVMNGGHGWSPQFSTFGPISPTWPQILQMEIAFFDQHLHP